MTKAQLIEAVQKPHKDLGKGVVEQVIDTAFSLDLNFVFGEADPKEGVAVISLWRLRPEYSGLTPDKALYHQRILKEANHGLGHTYNLEHYPDTACVMHFSNNIQDTDTKRASFCANCDLDRVQRQPS